MASPSLSLGKPWLNLPSVFLALAAFFCCCIPSFQAKVSYPDHCGAIVPQASSSSFALDTSSSVYISHGYFYGAGELFAPKSATPAGFNFYSRRVYRTEKPGLFHLTGSLSFQTETPVTDEFASTLRRARRRPYSRVVTSYSISANLNMAGFWSHTTGKVCMVGTGSSWSNGTSLELSAVFILNYPNNTNIYNSIVSGTVRSVDASRSHSHFETISVLGYSLGNYTYTQFPKHKGMCSPVSVPAQVTRLEPGSTSTYLQQTLPGQFRLVYGGDCSDSDCGPFSSRNKKSLEFLPGFMGLNWFQTTEEGKVHMDISFKNESSRYYSSSLVPGISLVSEGYWDSDINALCLSACPVLREKDSSRDSFVGECTIGLSFWFPSVLTISERSRVVGRMWSVKGKSDPGYFSPMEFRSVEDYSSMNQGPKYKYTKADSLRSTCETTKGENFGNGKFPDESSVEDLRFELTLKNAEGHVIQGYATPFSFGDDLLGENFYDSSGVSFSDKNESAPQTLWNISYTINYGVRNSSTNMESSVQIAAEGVYNTETGKLCMVGCKDPISSEILKNGKAKDFADCQIEINMQLSHIDQGNGALANGSAGRSTRHVNGTIRSTRNTKDAMYFEPWEISSYDMYATEAREVEQRMDMEIAMVVISLTLSCIFILFQIFHVRRHQDVLPSVSITMLVVLTLGYMVPLMLNLEALFLMNRKRSVLLWSGGWLEVNEVIVRVMTMLAFLLQCRLLQLAWVARSSEEGKKGLWAAEAKVLLFCLPLYFAGAVITWFVHMKSYKTQGQNIGYLYARSHPIRDGMISYFGLILDAFLLPQIILNITWNSKDKSLVPLFFGGTTAVRALPHLYDAYRASSYLPYFRFSYIYASPDGDYYSTAWDVIIPFVGVMFAVLICLQQRFSANCFLPKRFKKHTGYEMVPVISL